MAITGGPSTGILEFARTLLKFQKRGAGTRQAPRARRCWRGDNLARYERELQGPTRILLLVRAGRPNGRPLCGAGDGTRATERVRRNARASRARTRGRRCGEGALCAIAGQAPSARVLELRVHLPAVASMLQINIHAATTTLALCWDPDDEGWRRKQLAAKLPIPLPGACDPGAVREHCAARARTLCALLSLQSAPTGPLHTTLPTRLFASPPRDATPEGLCALHRSLLGRTVTCAADGFHVGGIFAAPVPALADAHVHMVALQGSGMQAMAAKPR